MTNNEEHGSRAPGNDGERKAEDLDALLHHAYGPTDTIPADRAFEILEREGGTWTRVLLREVDKDDAAVELPTRESDGAGMFGRRYQVFGEVARGGVGVVLRGRDTTLGRDVAIKLLREGHRDRPMMLDRFLAEAQIGAQLEHPGIVPVHEVGLVAGHRPFFTMKLVRGRTLAAILRGRCDPADDRPRFLSIFQQICQTVAYAHARSVVHRDLKPSNVMVGSFGEVQVMDWGMATVLRQGGADDEKRAAPPSDARERVERVETVRTGSSQSVAGEVFGTPAYMSPEQAAGESLDERSDVFSLGAILCEILTTRPPFRGAAAEAARQARERQLTQAFTSLDASGADQEIVALAKACLAPDPEHRPRDASALAETMGRHLTSVEERARGAELQAARAEAKAQEERKARRLTLALSSSLVAILLLGGGGWTWIQTESSARRSRTTQAVETALGEAHGRAREAVSGGDLGTWSTAVAAAQRAVSLAATGNADTETLERSRRVLTEMRNAEAHARALAAQGERDRELVERLERIRTSVASDWDFARQDQEYTAAFADAGVVPDAGNPEHVARVLRQSRVADNLVAALDDWIRARLTSPERSDSEPLLALAQAADPDPLRARLRELIAHPDSTAALGVANDADLAAMSANSVILLARALSAAGEDDASMRVLCRGQLHHPGDFFLNFGLAMDLLASGADRDEVVRYASVAAAIRPHGQSANNLGIALAQRGDLEEAETVFRRIVEQNPEADRSHFNLAFTLEQLGRVSEALVEYERAAELAPDRPKPVLTRARLLRRIGRRDEARREFTEALRRGPDDVAVLTSYGAFLCDDLQEYGEALALFRRGLGSEPGNANLQNNVGIVLEKLGDQRGALAAFQRAVETRPELASAHERIGTLLRATGDLEGAVEAYGESVKIEPDRVTAQFGLGVALTELGDPDGAIEAYRAAVQANPDLTEAWYNIGCNLLNRGADDRREAIAALRRACELRPDFALARYDLGRALYLDGATDEALPELQEAVRLEPDSATFLTALGEALFALRRFNHAIPYLQRTVALDPQLAEVWCTLGRALSETGDLEEALAALRRGHQLGSARPDWDLSSSEWIEACARELATRRKH